MAEPERRRRRVRPSSSSAPAPPPPDEPATHTPAALTGAILDPEAPPTPGAPAGGIPGERPAPGGGIPGERPPRPAQGRRPYPGGSPGAGPGGTPTDDREAERGLRGLVGSGSSQVSVGAALRARDAARPTDEQLAEADRNLTIVRRNWVPREDLPRNR
ncbi:hypothetical protein ACQP2F_07150 [Actinoplanes sp. CA-030573]|uniref:hypothetical protein n=1 Tax=Actinoplanes sp. CA-030573 TaxID=3239898 RepID=UPI003D945505